jgi:hypothetical protein
LEIIRLAMNWSVTITIVRSKMDVVVEAWKRDHNISEYEVAYGQARREMEEQMRRDLTATGAADKTIYFVCANSVLNSAAPQHDEERLRTLIHSAVVSP